ncbi:hypothetical protein ACHAXT_011597 [Thalassiosira profunda]
MSDEGKGKADPGGDAGMRSLLDAAMGLTNLHGGGGDKAAAAEQEPQQSAEAEATPAADTPAKSKASTKAKKSPKKSQKKASPLEESAASAMAPQGQKMPFAPSRPFDDRIPLSMRGMMMPGGMGMGWMSDMGPMGMISDMGPMGRPFPPMSMPSSMPMMSMSNNDHFYPMSAEEMPGNPMHRRPSMESMPLPRGGTYRYPHPPRYTDREKGAPWGRPKVGLRFGDTTSKEARALDAAVAPSLSFPETLFQIVSDPANAEIVKWLPHGRGFVVRDKDRFGDEILTRYFDGAKFTSFTRRLKRWHFERMSRGPEMGAYYHKNFVRDQPGLVLNMIYGKDGDEAMDEPSLSAAKTKRKEQSEKRKRQYQARVPRDDAAVAKALAERRRSSDQSAQSQASGEAAAMGRVLDGSKAAAPMPHHPKDFGIPNRHPAPPPKKAKPSPGRMPQAEGGMAFCVCGNTMSGKERRCVECTMQHKKWQQEGMGRSPPYENARMLQAMQNREDQQRWEEMQRMQRFSPSRRAAEMEMALERRHQQMGSMMPMPQMEMEMQMEMMRRRQQELDMMSPSGMEKQRMMASGPYPKLPMASPGGGSGMYNGSVGGMSSDRMAYARAGSSGMSSMGSMGSRYSRDNFASSDQAMMSRINASSKSHEEIMKMAAHDLQHRSPYDGPARRAALPSLPPPPLPMRSPMDDEEMALRELESRAAQGMQQSHASSSQTYHQRPPPERMGYSQEHARMLRELEEKVEEDMMLRQLEEKVERNQAAAAAAARREMYSE